MMFKNKIGIICQARLSSSRLPGKVLYDLGGENAIGLIYKRYSRMLDENYKFIIATSNLAEDQAIINFCEEQKINYFAGSLDNVLERYYYCAKKNNLEFIIRITADCPFLDFKLIPNMVKIFKDLNIDYISNSHNKTGHVPDGFDIEIFKMNALSKAMQLKDLLPSDKEHVTFPFINRENFSKKYIRDTPQKYENLRVTLDEPNDLKLIRKIIKLIGYEDIINYSIYDICDLILNYNLYEINSNMKKNSGWESSFKKDNIYLKTKKFK